MQAGLADVEVVGTNNEASVDFLSFYFIFREKRLQLNLSQNQFGKKLGIRRENVRDVELMKRNFSVKNFRKVLNSLDLKPEFMLNKLN